MDKRKRSELPERVWRNARKDDNGRGYDKQRTRMNGRGTKERKVVSRQERGRNGAGMHSGWGFGVTRVRALGL